jgi:NAD+ synthase (glutamine-hydrolysing)
MKHGFIKVASAVPATRVADCKYNVQQIESLIVQSEGKGVEVIVFPELCITGYSCQDLFKGQMLLDEAENAVLQLLDFTRKLDIIAIVGLPVAVGGVLLNCAAVIQKGLILGIIPKTYLPNYSEFYEKRWFASSRDVDKSQIRFAGNIVSISSDPQLFRTCDGVTFGIEICEDVWAPTPPSNQLTLSGADVIFNLSASDELIGKHDYLTALLAQQSARTLSGYVYSGCGFGESTQDVVYGGNALIFENGKLIAESERFSFKEQLIISQIDVERLRSERRNNTTFVNAQHGATATITEAKPVAPRDFEFLRDVLPHPFIPTGNDMEKNCQEIFNIQVAGLAKRLNHTGCRRVVIGISGGLDSTLALLVCVKTFDKLQIPRTGIIGVTMPGFGTTDRTRTNAVSLMQSLGVSSREINISDSVRQHFSDIGHDINEHDITYENSQARERTQILMDLSNQLGGLVIGTGDLSELALGWATYNGDHMSMYGVNAGVPKTLIKYLVRYVAESGVDADSRNTLLDIIDTPISPELIPADEQGNIRQKTEDLVGPYELHDFFLYYFLRYGFRPSKIYFLAKKAFDGTHSEAETYSDDVIKHWLTSFFRRFFGQQFKRSCLPDGPKVGSVSLSPRGDWRMPSDASCASWLAECEEL